MRKRCGNCANWVKMKKAFKGKGLCTLYDLGWCPSDGGKGCSGWVGVKYNRSKV